MDPASTVEPEPTSERPDPRIGTVAGGSFRLIRRLGSGGMGDVYEAEQVRLGRRVAVKVLRRDLVDRKETRLRFEREARLSARIASEHVVGIVDCGELADGTPFLAMDLVHGEDLRTRLSRLGRLPVGEAVALTLDACLGLAAVHRAGILHRDLKPANLFVVDSEDGPPRCKILDFGVAKALAASDSTRTGVMLGTPRYMAPEQIQPERPLDARADLYSLGAILYECLAGRPPHDAETREELLAAIVHRAPVPVGELRAELSPSLAALVMRCLERSPAARFQSADELARELARRERETHASDNTLADVTLEHDRPQRGRSRAIGYGLVGLAFGAAAGFGLSERVRAPAGAPHSRPVSSDGRGVRTAPVPLVPAASSPAGTPPLETFSESTAATATPAASSLLGVRRKPPPRASEKLLTTPQPSGGERKPAASATAPLVRPDVYLETESPYAP